MSGPPESQPVPSKEDELTKTNAPESKPKPPPPDQPAPKESVMKQTDSPESKSAPLPSEIAPSKESDGSSSQGDIKKAEGKEPVPAPKSAPPSVSAEIKSKSDDPTNKTEKSGDKNISGNGSTSNFSPLKRTAERPSEGVKNKKFASEEPLPTDEVEGIIHDKLRAIYKDEIALIAQNNANQRTVHYNAIHPRTQAARNYLGLVVLETARYIQWVGSTWVHFFLNVVLGGYGVFDIFTIFTFAAGGTIVLGAALVFCLVFRIPWVVRLYYAWSDRNRNSLGLVNAANPNIFMSLTHEQAEAAKRALSRSISETQDLDPEHERRFNYDISKLLLQVASVVYEHENDAIRKAVDLSGPTPSYFIVPPQSATQKRTLPKGLRAGGLFDTLLPQNMADKVDSILTDSKDDAKIHAFCDRFGLDFAPISQLGDTSLAFAGLFWDPKSNWIVVAFKGTGPLEFGEWLSDFDAKLYHIGPFIDGFSKVHKGFKDRLFPKDVSPPGSRRAYDNIALAVKTLAKWLRKQRPEGTEINVWVTGHSLGCATASLVYSRFLMRPKDIGKKSVLRDAYLFAAPIVADRPSIDVFNAKMSEDSDRPKTMWRITSNRDIVATGLPEIGDWTSINPSPNNGFAYAHLGTEIELLDAPASSRLAGNHLVRGSLVRIESEFTPEEIEEQRQKKYRSNPQERKRELTGKALQRIPLLGRLFAHLTVYYWDQLDRINIREPCSWAVIE